ncbi:FMN-binding protein [Bowmanella sp. JS7-9]
MFDPMMARLFILLASLLCATAQAEDVYLTPAEFIQQALGSVPKPAVIWLDDSVKDDIDQIMARRYEKLRVKYWREQDQTVWIMDEIGKESPITVGIHIKNSQIQQVKVLIYRESRGDEVRHDFFTNQFIDTRLDNELQLDQHIDGITGATLSVRALTKLSRLALYLHNKVTQSK